MKIAIYILIGLAVVGGLVYKAMNPAHYQHPLHRASSNADK
ncbi:MAG: hypothetical protein ABGW74_05200 [Campylobacterales bacterium]